PDRAGTLQSEHVGVEISPWNREEERADDNGSSGDGGKDWRIDLQREREWNGGGGETKRLIQTWKLIGKEDFINTGFYLRFKDQNSQQRLEENKMIIQFRGTQEEKEAYQEMMKEELEEGIVIAIQQDQVKWWNHTFLIMILNGTWRKILDASKLNKEIEKLHFKMHGLEELQYLVNQMDYATSLDLKSAFHHITVSPNTISYLPKLLHRSNRSNPQIDKNIFRNQNPELLRRHTYNSLRQINAQNISNGNNENIRTVRIDNISREERNRAEIDNNIPGMDMESERNEYKNVRGMKVKDAIGNERLVQCNIQKQMRENQTNSSTDEQAELSQTSDKGSVVVSDGI
ncbi:MAG: hypothetical protein EZS28_028988, partial [Streblomastix strix]